MMKSFFNMTGRHPHEKHRAATPLELFFDLVFVVAVALCAAQLHHGIVENHLGSAIHSYLQVFFAIWWAWMGFTWFASAFDVDDVHYRLMALLQMVGALVIAVGVTDVFEHHDWKRVIIGYCIMRVGLIALWWRAMLSQPKNAPLRTHALRQILGIVACQAVWISMIFWHAPVWFFWVMVVVELLMPIWAKVAESTPWHPHHIAERYGLLFLIVLGESILSLSLALKATDTLNDLTFSVLGFVLAAIVLLFSMWWLYFHEPSGNLLVNGNTSTAFLWGYGHYMIYASVAALGAGLAAYVDVLTQHAQLSTAVQGYMIALPVAIFIMGVWFCFERLRCPSWMQQLAFPIAACLVLVVGALPYPLMSVAGIVLLLLIWRVRQDELEEVNIVNKVE